MLVKIASVKAQQIVLKSPKGGNIYVEFRLLPKSVDLKNPTMVPPIAVCKSRILRRSITFVWNEQLVLKSEDFKNEYLYVVVWNFKSLLPAEPLGEAILDLSSLEKDQMTTVTSLSLERTGKGNLSFEITICEKVEPEKIIKNGYMDKQSKMNIWQSRWCVLKETGLFWCAYHNSDQFLGGISELKECVIQVTEKSDVRDTLNTFADKINRQVSKQHATKPVKPRVGYFFTLTTKQKQYDFKLKTSQERMDWMEALKSAGCSLQGEIPPSSNSDYSAPPVTGSGSTLTSSPSQDSLNSTSTSATSPINTTTTTTTTTTSTTTGSTPPNDSSPIDGSPVVARGASMMVSTVYTPGALSSRSNSQANLTGRPTSTAFGSPSSSPSNGSSAQHDPVQYQLMPTMPRKQTPNGGGSSFLPKQQPQPQPSAEEKVMSEYEIPPPNPSQNPHKETATGNYHEVPKFILNNNSSML